MTILEWRRATSCLATVSAKWYSSPSKQFEDSMMRSIDSQLGSKIMFEACAVWDIQWNVADIRFHEDAHFRRISWLHRSLHYFLFSVKLYKTIDFWMLPNSTDWLKKIISCERWNNSMLVKLKVNSTDFTTLSFTWSYRSIKSVIESEGTSTMKIIGQNSEIQMHYASVPKELIEHKLASCERQRSSE